MKTLRRSELKQFGEAGSGEGFVRRAFPFPLRASWDTSLVVRTFYGHEYIAEATIKAFRKILDYFGLDYIKEHDLDLYGGCFANRPVRGGEQPSIHAWGLAVDYLPHLGKLGEPSRLPYHCVKAFLDQGFLWGGEWRRPDGMHFTAVKEV